jgi:hypothetical protein
MSAEPEFTIPEPPRTEVDTDRYAAVYTDAERNAMRAYLQRTEVRNSTLHRVATAFVSGAGLMLLVPIFLKEIIDGILAVLLKNIDVVFDGRMQTLDFLLGLIIYALVIYPLIASLAIPLYALSLLLKDIVHFYFTLYAPGFAADLQHPTFSLSGVTFSWDESPRAKREILQYQYSDQQRMTYMIPFSHERREQYFDQLLEATEGNIIPVSRRLETLREQGVLPLNVDEHTVQQFNTALGMARALDRTLVEEVAYSEMAIVRNILYLRRLVLRYMKALLMFIWTTLISFIMLPLLHDARVPAFVILSAGYFVWSVLAVTIMELPIRWMYRHRRGAADQNQVDIQLRHLEYRVKYFIYIAVATSAIGFIVSIIYFFQR